MRGDWSKLHNSKNSSTISPEQVGEGGGGGFIHLGGSCMWHQPASVQSILGQASISTMQTMALFSLHTHTQLLAGSSSARVPQTKPPVPSSSFSSNPPPPTTPSGSSAGWAGKKRARTFDLDDNTKRRRTTPYSARQAGEKQHNKGLRHFSQRVCEKVREKGTTTYNEVGCYSSVCVTFPTTCSLLHVLYS